MNYTNEQLYEYGMRDIKGYEGLYAVTSCGRIWSYKKKIFLKPCKTKKGYLRIKLYKSGKYKNLYVHRIVMETYNPCENMKDLQVNHKSEIKIDNNLNNLEWCTAKENINYGTHNERSAAARSKKFAVLKLTLFMRVLVKPRVKQELVRVIFQNVVMAKERPRAAFIGNS